MNIKAKIKRLFFLVLSVFLLANTAIAASTTYTLTGKVMDTSDNWLNGARVIILPMKLKAKTNANGDFSITFTTEKPLKADKNGNMIRLRSNREGHKSKPLGIKSMDYLTGGKILSVKMEPEDLDKSIIGFTAEMTAPEKRKGTTAEFHVYIHESVKKVKAAFYISRHGMGDLTKPELKKFAKEEKVALIGMYGDPVQRGVSSVEQLDKYIKKLAKLSGHPELPNVPIMSFGHSNGTGFAASWPRDRPEKVIAWVGYHPGFNDYLQYSNTEKVPSLIMAGSVDKYLIKSRQDKTVANMRKTRNAAMNMMLEGDMGHGPADHGATWTFITEYLKAAMRIRLNDDGSLKPVKIKDGWLGEIYDFERGGRQKLTVTPYAKFKGDKSTANWLPDADFAKVWQAYGKIK